MPEFGQDSTNDPRLGDAPAASCFLPPPSRPPPAFLRRPQCIHLPTTEARTQDATGMQLCTVSIVEEKNVPPQQFSERAVAADAPPGFTHRLKASRTSTRFAGINTSWMVVRISAGHHARAGGDRELRQNVLDPFPEIHPPLLSPRSTLKDGY
ncbi:hypothetical protein B0H13DRAFT_2310295 [Mycena leptocephala]|nr:hypothetical protein B0H13DRAFT_2310295 [Mycena leptocephala]